MLDTANADLNVAIKIKREANQTHYTVYRNDSVIGKSKPYKASDSAVKSIHALKRCLATVSYTHLTLPTIYSV